MPQWEKWLDARSAAICHRQLVLLSGSRSWSYAMAASWCLRFGGKHLWLGDHDFFTSRGHPSNQAQKCLGQECDIAVYDGHSGLNASAFLSIAGTVRQNGLLILCIPPIKEWAQLHAISESRHLSYGKKLASSFFIQRWLLKIRHDPHALLFEEMGNNILTLAEVAEEDRSSDQAANKPFATWQQEALFAKICKQLHHQHVITARRGRGKSALLGLLASEVAKQNRKIVLCSPLKSGSETLLKYYTGNPNQLTWLAPDAPALSAPIDVLIIDEVASLPVKVALSLISHATVFLLATTVDGYEGSGRGFVNRLLPLLQRNHSNIHHHTLEQPIRYFNNDALEKHLTDAYLLDKNENDITRQLVEPTQCTIKRIHQHELVTSSLLPAIINILTVAHYKTSPEDIMRIVDMPDTLLFVAFDLGIPVAAAVIIEEGGHFLFPIADKIASGERRVKGHLLAQSVTLLLSDSESAALVYWRINRIAVHPNYQSEGIGSRLITYIEQHAKKNKVHFIGAAFSRNHSLLNFWHVNHFQLVRIGQKVEKASGEPSATVLKALNVEQSEIVANLNKLWVADSNSHIAENLTDAIRTIYQKRILDYVNGQRSHFHLGNALVWWLSSKTSKSLPIPEIVQLKWVDLLSEDEIIKIKALKGRKTLYKKLHAEFRYFYWQIVTGIKKAP